MAKSQYELLEEVLRRLDNAGLLEGMVLIGSWCMVIYKDYFGGNYSPSIKTRDVDFLVPLPPKAKTVRGVLKAHADSAILAAIG